MSMLWDRSNPPQLFGASVIKKWALSLSHTALPDRTPEELQRGSWAKLKEIFCLSDFSSIHGVLMAFCVMIPIIQIR